MGHDSEVTGEGGRNGAGPVSNVKGGGIVGAIILQQELGGDRGDAQVPDGFLSSGGATDHGYDGEMRGRRRVGLPSSR